MGTDAETWVRMGRSTCAARPRVEVVGRSVSGVGEYRVGVDFVGERGLRVALERASGHRVRVLESAKMRRLGCQSRGGLKIRLQVENQGTTRLRAKVWQGSRPEPRRWRLKAADRLAAMQAPGTVGLATASSRAVRTKRSPTLGFDYFRVRAIG